MNWRIFLSIFSTHKNLILYFCIGVSAAVIDVLVYVSLYRNTQLPAATATSLSVGSAILYAFLLNAYFNYKTSDNLLRRFTSYSLISGVGLLVSATIIYLLVDLLGWDGIIIKLATLPIIFLLQYSLNTKFTFHDLSHKGTEDAPQKVPSGKRVAVVGGGFTGLVAAYRLAQAGVAVTLYEREHVVGGLAGGFSLAGYPLEKAYHFLYQTDNHILDLAKELGIRDKVRFYPSSIGFFYNGSMYPFGTALNLLTFKPLPFYDRIRAGVVALMIQTVTNWEALQKHTAYEYLKTFCGKRITAIIWEPLLRGKFDRYYDKVTMSWLWGRIAIRAKSRDLTGAEQLGYVHGGFRQIVDRLIDEITKHGGTIVVEANLTSVTRQKNNLLAVTTTSGTELFDSVVFTTPSHVATTLLKDNAEITSEYVQKARSIDYLDAVILPFATTQEIGPYFWYNITDTRIPFLVLLSTSALTGTEAFGGTHIYYIGAYVPREHRYMTMPENAIRDEWYQGLKTMFPAFDQTKIVDSALFRLKDAQHIVEKNFRENKILPYETPVPGVFLANFTQIYPDDRGTNFAVREGTTVARAVLSALTNHV